MRVVIFGGAGFLGKQLALALLSQETLVVNGESARVISEIVIADKHIDQSFPTDNRLKFFEFDASRASQLKSFLKQEVDVIFHLAAVVSGEAELDFELGMEVNLYMTLHMLDLFRRQKKNPVFVFASSCAVFGGELSEFVTDATATTPMSSYGTQKAASELLINDYSRRGFVNGRVLRLPTIAIRPGKANAATSSFISSIVRDTLQGKRANCPVSKEAEFFILSPEGVIFDFIHAAGLKEEQLGSNRIMSLPGLTVSIQEMVSALEEIAGQEVVDRIDWKPDAFLESIVLTWPAHFKTERGAALGFYEESSVHEIIKNFIANHMNT